MNKLAAILHMLLLTASVGFAETPFVFRDVGEEAGIFPAAEDLRGHGAAWGDANGDGQLDLYISAFGGKGAKNNLLLLGDKGKFRLDEQPQLRPAMRATGTIFADLDNDGD